MSNKHYGLGIRGAVLALILSVAAFGIAGYMYYSGTNKAQQVEAAEPEEPVMQSIVEIPEETEAAPVFAQQESLLVPTVPEIPVTEPAPVIQETQARKILQTASPVPGNTIGEYAMDCLSYNETTRDWRTHNGIDLAAEAGSPVCAAADGTVYTTYEDDTMGYTVVIRHEGGYTTRYSSLDQNIAVQPGDQVTLGQTIGYAGDSALLETVMGSHVHFSVTCQDIPMNPEDFFALS